MRQLFLSFLLVGTLTAGAQSTTASQVARISTDDAVERPLFKTFPGEIPYRIPAIAVNRRGELIAVSDYRPCGGDIGFGKVDLRYRISDNNGATWSREYVLAEGDGVKGSKTCGYGDAAIAADRGSDEAVVVCVTGNTVYGSGSTTRKNPNRVAVLHSTDGGHHWDRPVDITEQIYALFDQSRLGPVDALFFGSGRICQSRLIRTGHYYRLYAALCARPGGNRVVYSDDLGRTWQALGDIHTSPAPNGDEPKVEELPNGDVLLSSRVSGGRLFNIFHYLSERNATGAWEQQPVLSQKENGGIKALQNSTNGEILLVDARDNATHRPVRLALQSVPLGPGRANVGIYYKALPTNKRRAPEWEHYTAKDFATGWGGPLKVTTLGSAYSTMVQQTDGRIAFFYEEETYGKGACYTNMYVPLTLERITDGKFSALRTQLPPKAKRR